MKKIIYIFLSIILYSCDGDWKAKSGIGCFMEDKLCFEYFDYSNSYEKYLTLTLNNVKYRVEASRNWSNWLECQVINNRETICSLQELNISMDKLRYDCKGKLDIMVYPKDQWMLKYYTITLNENSNPPYLVNEIDQKYIEKIGLKNWMNKQSLNYKQEILCPS